MLVSAKIGGGSGFDPRHDTISHNTITGNSPLDVFYDRIRQRQSLPGQHLQHVAAILDLQLS